MARIRTVKPEFFTHFDLFKAEKESLMPLRLSFQGLWLCADKEGRFKWQPAQLKLQILPYDNFDFYQILEALVFYKFILKYRVEEKLYGCIPSFKDHQRITGSEATAQSRLPGPQSGIIEETPWKPSGKFKENEWKAEYNSINISLSNIDSMETTRKQQGSTLDDWKGKEGKGREEEGKYGSSEDDLCYDIEKYILERRMDLEAICQTMQRDEVFVKMVLKKFHLSNVNKAEYPKKPLQLIAGLQLWILNERSNGTHQQVPAEKNGISQSRTDALKKWGLSGGEQIP